MNPQTRKLLIQRLIPAIGVIGPDFERFGGLILDHVLSTPLEHSGLNALGFLREYVEQKGGHTYTRFYGRPAAWMGAYMPKGRRVKSFHHKAAKDIVTV